MLGLLEVSGSSSELSDVAPLFGLVLAAGNPVFTDICETVFSCLSLASDVDSLEVKKRRKLWVIFDFQWVVSITDVLCLGLDCIKIKS